MRTTVRAVVGWVWLVGPLGLLASHIWHSTQTEFVRLNYYVVVWGSLLVLAACGFWFLVHGPGAKWLLRVAAVVVTLFVVLNFLIAWDHGGRHGNYDFLLYGLFGAIVLFCACTVVVAGMQPNSTPHPDARAGATLDQTPTARAGGRGR